MPEVISSFKSLRAGSQAFALLILSIGSNDSRLHVVVPPRGRYFIWQIGVNSPIQDHRQVNRVFFMESSQLYAGTLTHYSTEPLTTGPVYDPLLLLLVLAVDVHPNPGPSSYPCSVCLKMSLAKASATCVQDVCIGYIQDVLVFEKLQIIVEPMAGSVPPV